MNRTFNIYCDESCHLENDRQKAMVLGAVWCSLNKSRDIAVRLRSIKKKHGLSPSFEVKWAKISPSKKEFYLELIDCFFDEAINFRALVIPDKSKLEHNAFFGQDHDLWYYKMYFTMLKSILNPDSRYRIYIDIKDTRGAKKTAKLGEVLCNNMYDFSRQIIERIQLVHSHEIEQIQLADLLIGAVSYLNRGLKGNAGKEAVIKRVQERSGYSLLKSTLLREDKVNIFCWCAAGVRY